MLALIKLMYLQSHPEVQGIQVFQTIPTKVIKHRLKKTVAYKLQDGYPASIYLSSYLSIYT